ncbi:MAG TPA: hypothetical protein VE422_38805 [Terriglobia bacterium]|nr:hypothetical protein [Terriglobia bacterium]
MSNRNPEEKDKEKQGQWKKPGEENPKDPNREQKQQQPKQPTGQQPGQQPGQKPPQGRPGQQQMDEDEKRRRA